MVIDSTSGVHLVSWSSDARFVLAGTPSKGFRVWDTRQQWSHERWNVLQGKYILYFEELKYLPEAKKNIRFPRPICDRILIHCVQS